MTKAKISEYDAVAANNTDVNGVNIAEGCPPSGMNNMGREIMAALKRFQTGADGDSVTVGGSLVVSNTLTSGPVSATTLNTSGAVVFNDAGADVDFRVEGDTDANLLFVDAGNDRVGVKTSSPAVAFDVVGQVRASTGILFGTDTAAANALDDYEEGTWTPTALFSTSDGNRSYSSQVGFYTKIGNLVHLQGLLQFSETTASGNLDVGGLPFAASATSSNYSCGSFYVSNMTGLSGMVMGIMGGDATANQISMFYSGTGTRTNISNSNTGSNSQLIFDICYQV